MQVATTRFGSLAVDVDDLLHFPRGLMGFEDCRHWVLLADTNNSAVGWLQSADRPAVAVAVVSPRRFTPEYRIRVGQSQLAGLELAESEPLVRTVRRQQERRMLHDESASPGLDQSGPPPGMSGSDQ